MGLHLSIPVLPGLRYSTRVGMPRRRARPPAEGGAAVAIVGGGLVLTFGVLWALVAIGWPAFVVLAVLVVGFVALVVTGLRLERRQKRAKQATIDNIDTQIANSRAAADAMGKARAAREAGDQVSADFYYEAARGYGQLSRLDSDDFR